jgi:chromosome segregation ATPase
MNATPKEQTFLERAQEAIVYQRLGINKEKIDKLKEAIEDLSKELKGQGADLDIINDKINELEKMLEQEYEQGRDRMDMQPQHERGKIISALV